jgi:hypothetical protein
MGSVVAFFPEGLVSFAGLGTHRCQTTDLLEVARVYLKCFLVIRDWLTCVVLCLNSALRRPTVVGDWNWTFGGDTASWTCSVYILSCFQGAANSLSLEWGCLAGACFIVACSWLIGFLCHAASCCYIQYYVYRHSMSTVVACRGN